MLSRWSQELLRTKARVLKPPWRSTNSSPLASTAWVVPHLMTGEKLTASPTQEIRGQGAFSEPWLPGEGQIPYKQHCWHCQMRAILSERRPFECCDLESRHASSAQKAAALQDLAQLGVRGGERALTSAARHLHDQCAEVRTAALWVLRAVTDPP